ncbi:MAG: Nif3-like dinuclear metal center hexameric protein [Porphyromonadaceae bacterium]|nr:Nif3-like dinuclear metal center hexameric protein [Porphyromonadaceae bacterium]
MPTIGSIIRAIETVAPLSFQESYDNAGLVVGSCEDVARAAVVCLDVTEEVIDEAIVQDANLIISHHPLVFKSLKSLTGKDYVERLLIKAIKHDIAIYSAHTNMDNAWNGVNFKMAEKLGLSNLSILSPASQQLLKLVTYVPLHAADNVRQSLFNVGAGCIGNYDGCSYNSNGFGTFCANEKAHPYCGEIGETNREEEMRIEVILPKYLQKKVVDTLLQVHPYEEPAFDLIPLENEWAQVGSGVVGEFSSAISEQDFLNQLKSAFQVKCLRHSALTGRKIRQVALCGGAGSFLIPKAVSLNVDAFVTGEIKYHEFFGREKSLLLAEIGHYESEQYTKEIFCEIITKSFPTFVCYSTKIDTNPINYL